MMGAASRLREGLDRGDVPGLRVVGNPDMSVVAFMARSPKVGPSIKVFLVPLLGIFRGVHIVKL